MNTLVAEIDVISLDSPASRPGPGAWIHALSHLDPRYGGLSAAVPQLASAVAEYSGQQGLVAGFCSPDEIYSYMPSRLTVSRWPAGRRAWLQNGVMRERLREEFDKADGIHIHGIWEQSTASSAAAARSLRKPYVLSAHGMLDRWAVNSKRMKKALYAALTERTNVRRAACLHALTQTEVDDYRRFGATQPVAVIPNGVSVPAIRDDRWFFEQFPALRGKRLVLFLSRLHPKKGLDILAEAWGAVAKRYPDAHLVLAGPDSEGTRATIETSLAARGVSDSVLFAGMLDHEAKWSALSAAEAFVLPSYSEGLSVAILEAMGCGLPVLITCQCNLPEVARFDAGWTIEPNAKELSGALSDMLTNSPATNRVIGQNGRRLVEQNYSWPLIGRKMSEVYAWVLGGALPHSVELVRN